MTSCSEINTGIVNAFLEKYVFAHFLVIPFTYRGNVVALFVGHDHPNDFTVDYKGIMLAYGRKSGYGGYGIPHQYMFLWINHSIVFVREDVSLRLRKIPFPSIPISVMRMGFVNGLLTWVGRTELRWSVIGEGYYLFFGYN